jgi:hypothetical protein
MSQEKKQCPVCYEDLTLENVVNLPCNHSQCGSCFWKWTNEQGKQSCCMCRSDYLTHKNHRLNSEVVEANNALEWARRSLAECVRREQQIRLKVEDLYDEEVHKQELIENLQHIYNHEKAKIERLEIAYYERTRECYNLGCSLPSEGHKMSDDMLSLFYERRHKKRLDIAEKKRDGKFKKVVDELNNYFHFNKNVYFKWIPIGPDEFIKNQLRILKVMTTALEKDDINISDSTWMFEEDETNYGFWVTQAQTTMKPVYADIRMDKSKPVRNLKVPYGKHWVWSVGNYERKIVNWLRPEDYNKWHKWGKNEFLHFKRWHKRLIKTLRLTRDVKTEKGHRKRNMDVEENRMRKIWNERKWYKINKVDDLGEYCIRMFNEPPEFRPELEEGEIDEMEESEYGIDVEEEYNTSTAGSTGGTSDTETVYTTDSSMPELVEGSEDDELEYERDENVEENMMRLWMNGNITEEDVEHHLTNLENLAATFILQE